jgi:hypothetical protein
MSRQSSSLTRSMAPTTVFSQIMHMFRPRRRGCGFEAGDGSAPPCASPAGNPLFMRRAAAEARRSASQQLATCAGPFFGFGSCAGPFLARDPVGVHFSALDPVRVHFSASDPVGVHFSALDPVRVHFWLWILWGSIFGFGSCGGPFSALDPVGVHFRLWILWGSIFDSGSQAGPFGSWGGLSS